MRTPLRLSFKTTKPLGPGPAAGAPMAEVGQKGKLAGQFDNAGFHVAFKAFELDLPSFAELQTFPVAKLSHHARYQHLSRIGLGAQARGELNRRPKQVIALLDRLAGADADANHDRKFRTRFIMLLKRLL